MQGHLQGQNRTYFRPSPHHQASPDQRCHLPRLPRVVLERLGDLLGVEMERRVRNVREFAEALVVIARSAAYCLTS